MTTPDNTTPTAPADDAAQLPILTTIANLKRSVTGRALGLMVTTPSDREGMQQHRSLYRALDEMDMEYRAMYGLAVRSELPRWVQGYE